MNTNDRPRVLAFALDAAEPTLVRRMIEQDELPALKSLLSEGRWMSVKSPADIGSGSVWPSFVTGEAPMVHGIYGEWCWEPERMGIQRITARQLTPFWKAQAENGNTVGVLDVPFMPLIGLSEGFEVSEWGPHDLIDGRVNAAPAKVASLISNQAPHPLSHDRLDAGGPDDYQNLERLVSASLEGIRLRGSLAQALLKETRPDLSLIAFTEIHHAAHFLWHTVEPEHEVFSRNGFDNHRAIKPDLREIYCEVDRQIGDLIETLGAGTTIMVFSLHGMQPCHGVPTFLLPLLCEKGFARLADWNSKSWTERGIALMAAAKRRSPAALKKLYYKTMPPTATHRLAQPTMMPSYDWSQTSAFSLPSDQHGWIRINLRGREASGIVPLGEYEVLCHELEQLIRSLTSEDGKPLARRVIPTTDRVKEAIGLRIPDLVVHWEDEVFRAPLRIRGSAVVSQPLGRKFNGQHALEGFCIARGAADLYQGDSIRAEDLHRIMCRSLEDTRD
ncbi:MAG: alkaline phosphatase family protein [Pyrinomonadaceae bacterium]|nr:alkaline phosphatase family protein [Pyrinomonadaceae bacterium]